MSRKWLRLLRLRRLKRNVVKKRPNLLDSIIIIALTDVIFSINPTLKII